ncbi:MAG: chemotaxis protein CheW, partial [Pseudomonadota bacterium]
WSAGRAMALPAATPTLAPARSGVGVACRFGGANVLVSREEIREIMVVPPTTRVPGARAWVRGLANVRGQLLPLIDLNAFGGGDATAVGRTTRVIWVNHRTVPAGLLVDEVFGFRRFARSGRLAPDADAASQPLSEHLTGVFAAGEERWPVLGLQGIVESDAFLQAAEA